MKLLCFFLLVSLAYSQELVQDRKARPNLGPWIKGRCQRPTSGKCMKALTCCPSFTGVKIWTRTCHGIGCDEEKLVKEFDCIYRCTKEANWGIWNSEGCTPGCGKRQDATESFRRYCIDNKGNVVDDNFCPNSPSKTVKCKQDLPPCGEWTSWTAGQCSKTCGKGTQKHTRECPKNSICIGDSVKYEDCQVQECGIWSGWFAGNCSLPCGGGQLQYVRVCSSCSACEGDAEKVEACNTAPCDINECDLNNGHGPCENDATCTNTDGSYSCECANGWTGKNCADDHNECDLNDGHGPCENGGMCTNTDGSYSCECATGWIGKNCEEDQDECDLNNGHGPCENDAFCTNTDGSYSCECANGWTGKNCADGWLNPVNCDGLSNIAYYKNGNRYDISPSGGYSWTSGRVYCQSRGGDLAVTGMSDLAVREEIVDALNFHDSSLDYLWIGLQKIGGTWTYLDGTVPDDDSIHWQGTEPHTDYDAALIYVLDGAKYDLLTASVPHGWHTSNVNTIALCEYNCKSN